MNRKRTKLPEHMDPTRREFLWKGACAALTTTGMANMISSLRLINTAAAASLGRPSFGRTLSSGGGAAAPGLAPAAGTDYRALVCIFLFGGNDSNNVLIPTDTPSYAQYSSNRTDVNSPTNSIAIPSASLLPLNSVATGNPANDSHTFGVHPAFVDSGTNNTHGHGLAELYNLASSPPVAFVANVGTLLYPMTSAQYKAGSIAKPPLLFSHNDQQVEWQTTIEDQPALTGWAGRIADMVNSTYNASSTVSMNISLAGANVFETGNSVSAYNVSTGGAITLATPTGSGGTNQTKALTDLLALTHPNYQESTFASVLQSATNAATTLATAIAPSSATNFFSVTFPTGPSSLGSQLKMIARLIYGSQTLNQQRQIFFASIGGFDLHTNQGGSAGAHYNLLADLNRSMYAFYQATVQMGLATNVTTFTMSDFSRTFPMNTGWGTDHGWGSHHIVMGGAVQGGKIYGNFPTLVVSGTNDTSTGRWIPTTSNDQYAATLAKWFGVSAANLSTIFPYLGRFATPTLGFLG